ncbi:NADP oxidoreductase [candidate division GN15 bacterium]|nr:NADP oxidoreductase [candidate division GN15 bacterium]
MSRPKLATLWLDGCSGCHMSILDMDHRLLELAEHADIVYSPIVDTKEFPEDVDITLVEGAISTDEDVAKIKLVRSRTKILVSLGDCAATGNIPSMRNSFSTDEVLERTFVENTTTNSQVPDEGLPKLLDTVIPLHHLVKVDLTIPGCPPPADVIWEFVTTLLKGKTPELTIKTRFGK